MEIKLLTNEQIKGCLTQIKNLLIESDNDFVPPLSKRNSTTQLNFNTALSENKIDDYFNQMITQKILGVFENEKLTAIVAYKENYVCECIKEQSFPNIYVSTVIVGKLMRGKGVTKKAYDYLFNNLYSGYTVYTRTWSTNAVHEKILLSFGFTKIKIIKDDRGKGIDTVYYKRG